MKVSLQLLQLNLFADDTSRPTYEWSQVARFAGLLTREVL